VIQGKESTLPVTMDEAVYHTKIVANSVQRAMVIGDMPFMIYQVNAEDAVRNAGRLIKEGRAHAVKLEGGKRVLKQVKAISNADIPIMGHLGLTPQSINAFGGFKVQAKSEYAVQRLISDALALEDAGAFSIVLEAVPAEAARRVTEQLHIPTIGIGAGPHVDGQVLVTHDMLGYTDFAGKFVKRYALLKQIIVDAAKQYKSDVEKELFPTPEFSYNIEIAQRSEPDILEHMGDYKQDEKDVFDDLF
jgi:3-methyl-2-oxobutanoate hydroxymethyltransferase